MSRPADSDLGDADDMTTMHVRRAVGGDLTSLDWVVSRLAPLLVAQAQWRLGTALRRYYDPEDLVSDAWAVTLQDDKLQWSDGTQTHGSAPDASAGRKFQAWLARVLPVSSQL